jgi:DNA-binding NarL/FixJ family response regulator
MMATGCPYGIVLADDDAAYRSMLRRILRAVPGLDVLGESSDGLELLSLVPGLLKAPDLAIVDISMPNLGGPETLVRLKRDYPGMKVLMVSVHKQVEYLRRAISAGADGYLVKQDFDNEIIPALDSIRGGGRYVSRLFSPGSNGS